MILNNEKMLLLLDVSDAERFHEENSKNISTGFDNLEMFMFRKENIDVFRVFENQKILGGSKHPPEYLTEALKFKDSWNKICINIATKFCRNPNQKAVHYSDAVVPRTEYIKLLKEELLSPENAFSIEISKYPKLFNSFLDIFRNIQDVKQKQKVKESFLQAIFPKDELTHYFQNEGRKENVFVSLFQSLQVEALNSFVSDPTKSNQDKSDYIENNLNARNNAVSYESIILGALKNFVQFHYGNGSSIEEIKEMVEGKSNQFKFLERSKVDTLLVREYSAVNNLYAAKDTFSLDLFPAEYNFKFTLPLTFDKNIDLPLNRKKFLKASFVQALGYYLESAEITKSKVSSSVVDYVNYSLIINTKTIENLNDVKKELKNRENDFLNILLPGLLSEARVMATNNLGSSSSLEVAKTHIDRLDTMVCASEIEKALALGRDDSAESVPGFASVKL